MIGGTAGAIAASGRNLMFMGMGHYSSDEDEASFASSLHTTETEVRPTTAPPVVVVWPCDWQTRGIVCQCD
jgi:hypothetical protein